MWKEDAKLYAMELEMLEAGLEVMMKKHAGNTEKLVLMSKVITHTKTLLEYAETRAKENENE